jgi:prevent-host-death family protein
MPLKTPLPLKINIHEAKTNLSRLLVRVELGEEIILARAGKPVARLAPIEPKSGKQRLGSAAGEFQTPDDFNAPLPPEIEETFWR